MVRFFLLICVALFVWGDIILPGQLHPGDNQDNQYLPQDPLTKATLGWFGSSREHTYQYYKDNPSRFYLTQDVNITGLRLQDIRYFENNSNLSIWIDGELVYTGADGATDVDFGPIELKKGMHTIAVTGSCYYQGWWSTTEVSCSQLHNDVDDFDFSAIVLKSPQETKAYNFIERHHIGDDNDDDDDYDIDNDIGAYYPDEVEGVNIEYSLNIQENLAGFRLFISRLRDVHIPGTSSGTPSKLNVYDKNNNLIISYDINRSDTKKFDFDRIIEHNISGVSKLEIINGTFSGGGRDDLSFDELIFIPLAQDELNEAKKPLLYYTMDECRWDEDSGTYEIKNNGSLGDEANGSAYFQAFNENNESVGGGLCKVGNFIGSRQIYPLKNPISLGSIYTISTWIKFPLDPTNHETYRYGRYDYQYYNIADRDGSLSSFIFFVRYKRTNSDNWKWTWCVDDQDGDPHCSSSDFSMPDGWHMVTFVVSNNQTRLFIDDQENSAINYALMNVEIDRIFASDFQDNEGNQTIGAYVDEFKIFDRVLDGDEIEKIYQNERSGKNWDGSTRVCPSCVGSLKVLLDFRMDECSWETQGDVKNSVGIPNATALEDANTTDEGEICRGGSFKGGNKALRLESDLSLPRLITLNVWIKFPLDTSGHKELDGGYRYFNIADRKGTGGDDFIYFTLDPSSNWFLTVDDDDGREESFSFDPQSLSGWHMLSFVISPNTTLFYLDSKLKHTFSTTPNSGVLGLLFNSDYGASSSNQPNGQSIGADVDEFILFDGLLSQEDLARIFNRQNNGKNYDDTPRICPICGEKSFYFDAWDIFRSITDRNISTKIVNEEFNLTIASLDENGSNYQEFNGTVCAQIDSNISKAFFDNEKEQNLTFKVERAIKSIKVKISWKKNKDESCPLSNEDNSSESSDDFAIRPDHFKIDIPPGAWYAGEEHNISFIAKDSSLKPTLDYNESNGSSFEINISVKSGCKKGSEEYNDTLQFENGELNRTLRYGEVGGITISIEEIDGSEFAKVDRDDTSDSQRLIERNETTIHIAPYEINVTKLNVTTSFNEQWLYMSQNLSDNNVTIFATIGAFNKQGELTQDYNQSCYGDAITTLNYHYDVNNTSIRGDSNVAMHYLALLHSDMGSSEDLADINISYDLNTSMFMGGEANTSYAFGIDKNVSDPLSPIEIGSLELNISGSDAKYHHGENNDTNVTFYYARLSTQDLETQNQDANTTAKILVYDRQGSSYVKDFNETLLNWYHFIWHTKNQEGNVSEANGTRGVNLNDPSLGVDITIASPQKGSMAIEVSYTGNKATSGYIHLDISPWLWYVPEGFGGEYSYSSDSDCTTHPCFHYHYIPQGVGRKVQSGDTKTTTYGDINATSHERGVRILR